MLNDNPNEMKVHKFRTCTEEFTTTFRLLFLGYISTQ